MPIDYRLIIFPWTTRHTFVGFSRVLFGDGVEYLLLLLLSLSGDVDVGYLKIHLWNQLNASYLGDNLEDFRTAPCVVDERGISKWLASNSKVVQEHRGLTVVQNLEADSGLGY